MSAELVPGFSSDQAPPSARWMGMELVEWNREANAVRVSFDPPRDVINFGGVIQGGFLTAMMDDAMGFGAFVSLGMAYAQASIDIHTHFFRPVPYGRTEVEARIVRAGRSVAFLEAELFDKDGVLAARTVSSTRLTPLEGGDRPAEKTGR